MRHHRSAVPSRPVQPASPTRAAGPARPPRLARAASVLGLATVLAFTASGCFGASRPSPQDTAAALSSAVASGDFSQVPLTPESRDVPEQLAEALADLEDVQRDTTVVSATVDAEDGNRATATLRVGWQFDGGAAEDSPGSPGATPGASATGTSATAATTSSSAAPTDSADGAGTRPEGNWAYETTTDLVWDEDAQQWQVDLAPDTVVPGLAEGGTVTLSETPAERGSILDAAGEELMTERGVARLGLDKSRLDADQVASSAQRVAEVLEVDPEAFAARAEAAGDQAFVEAITLRTDGSAEIPTEALLTVPGGRIVEDTAVLAPTRTFAREVLGTYGEPNAEQIEDSQGELTAGVAVGLSGLQATWEDRLAGDPGLEVTITNPAGSDAGTASVTDAGTGAPSGTATGGAEPTEQTVFSAEPVDGQDVTSTLNSRVQQEAEAAIADSDVPAGLVAIRPSDGQVLAAASGPEGWPVAASGSYAPGSTFKVVTTLALLRAGLDPQETVQCPASITIDGMVVGNYDEYPDSSVGAIPFTEAFAESCNTVFVGAHNDISAADENEAAEALGLASDPQTGLDGTFLGSVPADSTGTRHAANLFGQGVVETSPLGMATVAASVAAGHTVRPVFVDDPSVQTEPAPESGVTAEEAAQLRELMAGVVQDGTAEMLQDVPGAPVLAKTGTAQFVADGEDLAHTWLIAIHGDLAVALFFNEGLGGGFNNGPVVRDFLTAVEEIIPSEG